MDLAAFRRRGRDGGPWRRPRARPAAVNYRRSASSTTPSISRRRVAVRRHRTRRAGDGHREHRPRRFPPRSAIATVTSPGIKRSSADPPRRRRLPRVGLLPVRRPGVLDAGRLGVGRFREAGGAAREAAASSTSRRPVSTAPASSEGGPGADDASGSPFWRRRGPTPSSPGRPSSIPASGRSKSAAGGPSRRYRRRPRSRRSSSRTSASSSNCRPSCRGSRSHR